MKKIKILTTGALGQLGKTIEELFSNNENGLDFTFVSKEALDITDRQKLKVFFNANKFDYCINCAAYTNVEQAEKTPEIAYQINSESVKNLAQICAETNTVLIHISTDYVFDGKKNSPYEIMDLPNPINHYGMSKLLGENHIRENLKKYFIVRTSWLYSKKYGNNFYRMIINLAKIKQELAITTQQIGCPTDTENLAEYLIKLIKDENVDFGIKHFSDEKAMTWFDFAQQILVENNLSHSINLVKTNNYITFASRPKYSVLKTI